MANSLIPLRFQFTGSAVTAVAEYQSGETLTHPGNLQLTGNGRVFQANFSDAVFANRAAFQDIGANNNTTVNSIPNGTGNTSGFYAFNTSVMTNSSYLGLVASSTTAFVDAGKLGTGTYLPLVANVGGTERWRTDTNGNFFVGATSITNMASGAAANPGFYASGGTGAGCLVSQCNNNANFYMAKASGYSSGQFFSFNVNNVGVGSISTNGTTTAYNTSSDHRLKDDVQPLDEAEAEARIMAYEPCTWTWKIDGSYGKGFIAHKNQAIDPETATGEKDAVRRVGSIRLADYSLVAEGVEEPSDLTPYGEGASWSFVEEVPVYQGRDDTKMIPDMVAMLQKMRRELSEAQAEIAALKAASSTT